MSKRFFSLLLNKRLKSYLDSPVIIVGCNRSGTTALYKSLNAHPNIHMLNPDSPMLHQIGYAAYEYATGPKKEYYRNSIPANPEGIRQRLRDAALESTLGPNFNLAYNPFSIGRNNFFMKAGRSLQRWGTKAFPDQKEASGIEWLFPNTKVIYIYRNGIDVVNSMNSHPSYQENAFEDFCREWNNAAIRYKHYLSSTRYMSVKFDDFLDDPEKTLRLLLEYISLPYDKKTVEFASSNHIHPLGGATVSGNPREILKSRPSAWENWDTDMKNSFSEICGESMSLYGYEMPFSKV